MKKNPVLVALGRNVRELREQKKLTQEALAERSGDDKFKHHVFKPCACWLGLMI